MGWSLRYANLLTYIEQKELQSSSQAVEGEYLHCVNLFLPLVIYGS